MLNDKKSIKFAPPRQVIPEAENRVAESRPVPASLLEALRDGDEGWGRMSTLTARDVMARSSRGLAVVSERMLPVEVPAEHRQQEVSHAGVRESVAGGIARTTMEEEEEEQESLPHLTMLNVEECLNAAKAAVASCVLSLTPCKPSMREASSSMGGLPIQAAHDLPPSQPATNGGATAGTNLSDPASSDSDLSFTNVPAAGGGQAEDVSPKLWKASTTGERGTVHSLRTLTNFPQQQAAFRTLQRKCCCRGSCPRRAQWRNEEYPRLCPQLWKEENQPQPQLRSALPRRPPLPLQPC